MNETNADGASSPPVLALEGVSVSYGSVRALRGVRIELRAGDRKSVV